MDWLNDDSRNLQVTNDAQGWQFAKIKTEKPRKKYTIRAQRWSTREKMILVGMIKQGKDFVEI